MAKRIKSKNQRVNLQVAMVFPHGVKLARTLEGHRNTVMSVAFDPHGGMLASGSADKTVKLWEARSGTLLRTLEGHQGGVDSVAFGPKGDILANESTDTTVKLWDSRSGKLLHTFRGHDGAVKSVAFNLQQCDMRSLACSVGGAPAAQGRKGFRFLQRLRREADVAGDGGTDPVDP